MFDWPQRRVRFGLLGALFLALMTSASWGASPTPKVLRDDWLAVYLQGHRIGYCHTETFESQVGGRALYETRVTEKMTVTRAQTDITILVASKVVEDKGGRLVSFLHSMQQAGTPIGQTTRGEVNGDELVITTGRGPNAQKTVVAAPIGLCPWALEEVGRVKGYEAGTEYSLPVFLPPYPTKPSFANVKIGQAESKYIFEVVKELHPVAVELSVVPDVPAVSWVDSDGVPWLTEATVGPFRIEALKVSKEIALQPPGRAEILMASAILPDRPIPDPRNLEALEVHLWRTGSAPGELDLPTDAYQKVAKEAGGLRVTVRRAHGSPERSYPLPYKGEEWADLLKASAWLEVNDPLIVRMAREAVGGETDALEAARKLEGYVRKQIKGRNLSMGFATALETAKQKAGDCSEHAVLLAALARAAGMPSRVVTGLAYGGPMAGEKEMKFFYHMWTEVYVGEWLPLDAALGAHDATHIAISRSTLDVSSDMLTMSGGTLSLLGVTRIKVLRIRSL